MLINVLHKKNVYIEKWLFSTRILTQSYIQSILASRSYHFHVQLQVV